MIRVPCGGVKHVGAAVPATVTTGASTGASEAQPRLQPQVTSTGNAALHAGSAHISVQVSICKCSEKRSCDVCSFTLLLSTTITDTR